MCVCVCVCEREIERQRERDRQKLRESIRIYDNVFFTCQQVRGSIVETLTQGNLRSNTKKGLKRERERERRKNIYIQCLFNKKKE